MCRFCNQKVLAVEWEMNLGLKKRTPFVLVERFANPLANNGVRQPLKSYAVVLY